MLRLPALRGTIDRRILVNYRVDPDRLAPLLPEPFRPKLVGDRGVAGICLIRLKSIRPRGLPPLVTLRSENAAHRIAVEWEDHGDVREGVYVPRRDTSSCMVSLLGGRLFPGALHYARFDVEETDHHLRVEMISADGVTRLGVEASLTDDLQETSVFGSLDEASAFFEAGSVAYSPGNAPGVYDGMELRTYRWHVEPLNVTRVHSSFFEQTDLFPPGTVTFDNALLMRRIEHEWHEHGIMRTTGPVRLSA